MNAVLQQNSGRPWSKHIPDGPWDYVVIGSGMGGMTTAALLAKCGKRVLVLEQHYVPGGFTHTFKRHKWVWDVGVHAVGEVTEHALPGRLLAHLTDGRLEWASLGEVYEEFHYPDDFRIDFPDNPTQLRQNLIDAFPDQVDAIDRYLAMVRESSAMMRGYYMGRLAPRGLVGSAAEYVFARKAREMFRRRCREVVDELTDDPRLRAVMVAQWGYYGAPPSRASFAVQAIVVKHFMWGGYYPVGGSGAIATELLRTVADAGGWTAIRADVERIVVERGTAVGVRLAGGREIRAARVISATGLSTTVRRLLSRDAVPADWAHEVEEVPAGPAHLCLYLGFSGDIRQAGASGANKWFYETWETDTGQDAWEVSPDGDFPDAPVLYCSFPSLKDPTHDPGPDRLHTGEVVTFAPWETFAPWREGQWRKRGPEYEAFKQRVADRMLEQFLRHMPGLRPMVKHAELSTPISTDHFVRPFRGSIYGLSPTPDRFANPNLRPRSPVKNLFFSGSEVTVGGVVGALMGGVLAALAAEPVKVGKIAARVLRRPAPGDA